MVNPQPRRTATGQVRRRDGTPFGDTRYTLQAFDQIDTTTPEPLSAPVPLQPDGTYAITYTWTSTEGRNGPNLLVRLLDPQGNVAVENLKILAEFEEVLDLEGDLPADGPQTVTLSGVVRDYFTGTPLPNVSIDATVRTTNEPALLTASAQANSAGEYTLTLDSRSWDTITNRIDVEFVLHQDNQALANVATLRGLQNTDQTFDITAIRPRSYTLSGTVTHATTGDPVPNIKTELSFLSGAVRVGIAQPLANQAGRYSASFSNTLFANLEEGAQMRVSVRLFQNQQRIPTPSVLSNLQREDTQFDILAQLSEEPGEPEEPENPVTAEFVVQGTVSQANGNPLSSVRVYAVDRDMRSEEVLGGTITDATGAYTIEYSANQFRRAEKTRADLVVRATDNNGRELAASDIVYNADPVQTINLTVQPQAALSEYERLVAALTPLVQDVPFADLIDDDLAFLVGETNLERELLETLRQAAQLARDANLPTEVFYGLIRKDLPSDLDQLLALPTETLLTALEAAIDDEIIPTRLRDSLDEILARWEQLKLDRGVLVRREVYLRLLRESGEPLSGYPVRVYEEDNGRELAYDITNGRGIASFAYIIPRDSDTESVFALTLLEPESEESIFDTEINVTVDLDAVLDIQVPEAAIPQPPSPTLDDLQTTGLQLPQALTTFLTSENLTTLKAIREAGGMSRLDNLPVSPDDPAVKMLEAHTNLGLLSENVEQNAYLIDQGYTSVNAVANTTRADFVNATHEQLGDFKAAQLHVMADAQKRYLSNVFMGIQANRANGLPTNLPPAAEKRIIQLASRSCDCQACEAAVSPTAYLADLLDYALTHVKRRSASTVDPITLDFLIETFHQPFGSLPTDCDAVETRVRQVRLCVEVLRRYLGVPSPISDRAEQQYTLAAYTTLLTKLGTSYAELRLARTAEEDTRQRLADRLGIDLIGDDGSDHLQALLLYPDIVPDPAVDIDVTKTITEEKLERLFGLVATQRIDNSLPDPLRDVEEGVFKQWRLQHLRTLWQRQDWPEDPYREGLLPIIDPDVIGPDDFRNPTASNPAFARWQTRRADIDDRLNRLRTVPEENKLNNILQQVLGDPLPDLAALLTNLTSGTAATVASAKTEIETLNLTVESFTRLMAIKAKDDQDEAVEAEEWEELYSILVQAQKIALFSTWLTEEQTLETSLGHVLFGPKVFWISLREPQAGQWPPLPTVGQPLIDPEIVELDDLPEATAGQEAISLWQTRSDRLQAIETALKAEREAAGFVAMLSMALGDPPAGETWDSYLANLRSALSRGESAAEAQIETTLHMTVEQFQRLMEIKDKSEDPRPERQPTAAEWQVVYAMLTSAQKVRSEYAGWVTAESSFDYWRMLKAKLPKWRSAPQARPEWQKALQQRSSAPVIDPDLISPSYLKHPVDGNLAHDIWKQRWIWLQGDPATGTAGRLQAVKDQREATGADVRLGFNTILETTVGISIADLENLIEERNQGHTITPRLAQLGLPLDAFTYLVRISNLISNGAELLDAEWNDNYSILVQVEKRREFGDWREQECLQELTLSQDAFKLPEPPFPLEFPLPEPEPMPAWRATERQLRDWKEQLETRIEQEETVIAALQEVISATEEETLPALRDALIMATDSAGTDLSAKAKSITELLLIDAKADGCQITTRISQAIETIQGLLWALRTGQLQSDNLLLDADHFDDEWQWIGSYATWRAAMFVFLYPENILIPTLRKRQTPAFRELSSTLRKNRRLTPEHACEAANTYADYFRDICTLEVESTCQTRTRVFRGNCRNGENRGSDYRNLFYMFGRGSVDNRVYWSAYDPEDETGYAQTFWAAIPGFKEITKIVGSVPYEISEEERYIFLFLLFREKGEQKLVFIRYNLGRQIWDEELNDSLNLPSKNETFSVLAVQSLVETRRPRLVLHNPSKQRIYARYLNHEGLGWEDSPTDNSTAGDEWEKFRFIQLERKGIKQVHAVLDKFYINEGQPTFLSCWVFKNNENRLQVHVLFVYLPFPFITSSHLEIDLGKSVWLGSCIWDDDESKDDFHIFYRRIGRAFHRIISRFRFNENVSIPGLDRLIPDYGHAPRETKEFAYQWSGRDFGSICYRNRFKQEDGNLLPITGMSTQIAPVVRESLSGPLSFTFDITEKLDQAELQRKRNAITSIFQINTGMSNLVYLEEAYYFVPIQIALQLQQRGHYIKALDWFRTVYDYSVPPHLRQIYSRLEVIDDPATAYQRSEDWLLDPLNPHLIASTRAFTYTRFTLMALVRCLLDYADAEFTRDTAESLPRARTLYLTALELLETEALNQSLHGCDELIGELDITVGEIGLSSASEAIWSETRQALMNIGDRSRLEVVTENLKPILVQNAPTDLRIAQARSLVDQAVASLPEAPQFATVVAQRPELASQAQVALVAQSQIATASQTVTKTVGNNYRKAVSKVFGISEEALSNELVELPDLRKRVVGNGTATNGENNELVGIDVISNGDRSHFALSISFQFCIPPNPILDALRLRAELNLHKLRTCRNIAGVERQLDPYSAPTDTTSGLPQIGVGGQLVLPGTANLQPTLYRYPVLIERAKQLVQLAAQVESTMLSALEKRDAEYYNLLKARQDAQLTRQGVRLQTLRVKEAQNGVKLAELQQERSQIQFDEYSRWIIEGVIEAELALLDAYEQAADAERGVVDAGVFSQIARTAVTAATADFSAAAAAFALAASVASSLFEREAQRSLIDKQLLVQQRAFFASFERRLQEWELQQQLSQQDIRIGAQQVTLAQDRVRIVGQEQKIAEIQAEHAQESLGFLSNKFTNVELYDWMSDILERVYSFFLQEATAMAKLAENQLAFERQEIPPAFIQADYWESPTDDLASSLEGNAPDRRGLTGSARLLQDIYQLDQYAFETNQRKLQLTKTISLSQLDPFAFARFRETGILRFNTPMELFDRDFPGHYLRLIQRVRTSVIALVPPTDGIRATLLTTGASRVVIGGDIFQTTVVRRAPESVALSSPIDATGVFELQQQSEMLLPFEGIGVDTSWEFQMPKAANRFNYTTIADVLITLEYTALNSFTYRQQVIRELDQTISNERPFSFRNQFADAWYDLNNPDQTTNPMVVRFETQPADFPPNIDSLTIQQVTLYFRRKDGEEFEVPVTHLYFTERSSTGRVGGSAQSIDGIISTRRGNASSWTIMIGKSPIGCWELAFPDDPRAVLPDGRYVRDLFKQELIEDILFVITFKGTTLHWPS